MKQSIFFIIGLGVVAIGVVWYGLYQLEMKYKRIRKTHHD